MSNFDITNTKSWSAPSIEELSVDLSSVAGLFGDNCETDEPRAFAFGNPGACAS